MKYLKWFYYASTSLFTFGAVYNIATNESDGYQIWFLAILLAGVYLIEEGCKKK